MSTADHATCCCAETINDLRALNAAYKAALPWITAANRVNEELAHRLTEAIAERDRARGTAARLEAELARGFRIAAPDITLTRAVDPIARHGCRRSGVVAVSAPE